MFVPKVPRRYDFCGCPPCGLCFDWVEPAPPPPKYELLEISPTVTEIRVDGIVKMTEDLTGKPFSETTEAEQNQVKGIAEDMHNRNLVGLVQGLPPEDEGAFFDRESEEMFFNKAITQKRKELETQRKYEKAQAEKKPSLDQMDWGASEEAKELNDDKKQERKKEKELQKAANQEKQKERTRLLKEQQEAYERMLQEYGRSGPFR